MGVYVDEIREWPTPIRCFHGGSCHMTADTLDELHAFARELRLKAEWFQPQKHPIYGAPHYDLTPAKREKALALGAIFVSAKEQARQRAERRRTSPKPGGGT